MTTRICAQALELTSRFALAGEDLMISVARAGLFLTGASAERSSTAARLRLAATFERLTEAPRFSGLPEDR